MWEGENESSFLGASAPSLSLSLLSRRFLRALEAKFLLKSLSLFLSIFLSHSVEYLGRIRMIERERDRREEDPGAFDLVRRGKNKERKSRERARRVPSDRFSHASKVGAPSTMKGIREGCEISAIHPVIRQKSLDSNRSLDDKRIFSAHSSIVTGW